MNEIIKGSTVRFRTGYFRVSALFPKSRTANLAGIFSSRIHHKKVSLDELVEAYDEWYAKWQQSETYKCM